MSDLQIKYYVNSSALFLIWYVWLEKFKEQDIYIYIYSMS